MHAMAWSMVNFPLADRNALYGKDEEQRNALLQLLVDGWEPFATMPFGDGMMLSLRKQVRQAPVFNPEDLPGMYL